MNTNPALEAALADALAERDRLDIVIQYLSERLGRPAPEGGPNGGGGRSGRPRIDPHTGKPDPLSLVAEGEFFGDNAPTAALKVLEKVGKPNALRTEELVRALKKGGVPVKDPGTLYRSIVRNRRFAKVGRGLWGLSSWYPGATRTPGHAATAEEPLESPESEERPDVSA